MFRAAYVVVLALTIDGGFTHRRSYDGADELFDVQDWNWNSWESLELDSGGPSGTSAGSVAVYAPMPLLNASVEAQLIESDGLMGLMYGGLQLSSAGNGEAVESYRVVSDRLWQLQSSATGAGWTVLDRLEGQDWPTPRFFHSAVVLHSDTPFEQESVVTPWNFSLSESDKASAAMVIFGGSETLTVQNQSEYTRPVAATYRLALSSNPELQAQNISNWTPS
eukprot:m.15358 g.15358  ORF g.15358 m.15358 type:complete len:222 (-) comp4903_c0_seq1:5412-6077(-)